MADQLRKRAKRAYPVSRSPKVVKEIPQSAYTALRSSMASIGNQSRLERNNSVPYISRDSQLYHGEPGKSRVRTR